MAVAGAAFEGERVCGPGSGQRCPRTEEGRFGLGTQFGSGDSGSLNLRQSVENVLFVSQLLCEVVCV